MTPEQMNEIRTVYTRLLGTINDPNLAAGHPVRTLHEACRDVYIHNNPGTGHKATQSKADARDAAKVVLRNHGAGKYLDDNALDALIDSLGFIMTAHKEHGIPGTPSGAAAAPYAAPSNTLAY